MGDLDSDKPGRGAVDQEHTPGGAPTDEAHQAVGDGTLTGAVPAGLGVDELLQRAEDGQRDDPGSE